MRVPICLALLAPALCAQGYVQVSRENPRYLELSTGESYIPIGLNIAWERHATAETEVFAQTDRRLQSLAAAGGNFARIWLSHPFYDIDPSASREETDRKLERIDRLVAMARRHRIRLKLCLAHFRTMEPLPPAFPGSVSMGRPDLRPLFGDMTKFFAGPEGRAWYLKRLDLLAARYSQEPTVMGWELWNEINAVRGSGWEEWTAAMLPELKRRFPKQLAMQSLGSFDRETSKAFYRRVSTMQGNELAQVHRYLDPGAALAVCQAAFDELSSDATQALLSFGGDRPVLASEVGAVEANHAGPSRLYEKDRDGILLHDGLFAPFFSGAAGPGHFWHWQEYVEPNQLWYHFARFAEAIRGVDPRAEHFEPATIAHGQLRVYVLKGRMHTLAWVRDQASDWQSELVRGVPAARLSGLSLPLPGSEADIYDPWTNRHVKVRARKGSYILPAFRRSVVIRIGARRG